MIGLITGIFLAGIVSGVLMFDVPLTGFFDGFTSVLGGSLRYTLALAFAILLLRCSMRYFFRFMFVRGIGDNLEWGDALYHRNDDGVIEKYEKYDTPWRPPRGYRRSELDEEDRSFLGCGDDDEEDD